MCGASPRISRQANLPRMYAGLPGSSPITVPCVGYGSHLLGKQSYSACMQACHAAAHTAAPCVWHAFKVVKASSWFKPVEQAKPVCMCTGTPGSSPYHCPMCGVWVSSQPLLEAHFKGRRHLKRALEQADADATNLGLQPGTAPDTTSVPRSVPCQRDLELLGSGVRGCGRGGGGLGGGSCGRLFLSQVWSTSI